MPTIRAVVRGFQFDGLEGVGYGIATIAIRALFVAFIASALAVLSAFRIAQVQSSFLRVIILVFLLLPFLTSDVVRAFGWSELLGPDGPVARLARQLPGNAIKHISYRYSWGALTTVLVVTVLPFGVLAIYPSMPRVSSPQWLASREMTNSRLAAFSSYGIPVCVPSCIAGVCMMFVIAMFASVEERFVGNSVSMAKLVEDLLRRDETGNQIEFFVVAALTAVGVMGLAALGGVMIAIRDRVSWFIARVVYMFSGGRKLGQVALLFDRPFGLFITVLILTVLVCGLAPIVWASIALLTSGDADISIWERVARIAESGRTSSAIRNTLQIAFLVGVICAIVGPVVGILWWRNRRLVIAVLSLTAFGAVLPPEATALGLISTSGIEGGGTFLLVIGNLGWAMPFVIAVAILATSSADVAALSAACEFDGAWWRTWLRMLVPLFIGTLAGCFCLGFLLVVNEYARSRFLRGTTELVSSQVYSIVDSGLVIGTEHRSAAAFVLTAGTVIILIVMVLSYLAYTRFRRKSTDDRM